MEGRIVGTGKRQKKEEFPGFMQNMPPGNSFPQICVVSESHSVETVEMVQDYGNSVDLSNPALVTHQ
jgi:hypothetical protein